MQKELLEGMKKCNDARLGLSGTYCAGCPMGKECAIMLTSTRITFEQFGKDSCRREIRVEDDGDHSDIRIMDERKEIVASMHILKDEIHVFPTRGKGVYIPMREDKQ